MKDELGTKTNSRIGIIDKTEDNKNRILGKILFQQSRGRKTRIKILNSLKTKPMNCHQLSQQLKLSWKSIKYHLKLLHQTGCIEVVKLFKKHLYYNITEIGRNQLNMINIESSISNDHETIEL